MAPFSFASSSAVDLFCAMSVTHTSVTSCDSRSTGHESCGKPLTSGTMNWMHALTWT